MYWCYTNIYTVERVFFAPDFFPRFSENEVFVQCYFHDFHFICSLSLVTFHFRAVLFSRFFANREKRENITGAKNTCSTVIGIISLVVDDFLPNHWRHFLLFFRLPLKWVTTLLPADMTYDHENYCNNNHVYHDLYHTCLKLGSSVILPYTHFNQKIRYCTRD